MNEIHILTIKSREEVFEKSKNFWESYGWKVIPTYNDGEHPSVGRNKILRKFYDSNDDWICVADDDIVLLNQDEFNNHPNVKYLEGVEFPTLNYIDFLTNNERLFESHFLPTSFCPTNPVGVEGMWVCQRLSKLFGEYKRHWVFERLTNLSCMFFHRNTKKLYDKEFYQDETLPAAEDWEWSMRQIDEGLTTARLTNIVCGEITGKGDSAVFPGETISESKLKRRTALVEAKQLIEKKYNDISLTKNGGLNTRQWIKRKWNPPTFEYGLGSPWDKTKLVIEDI